jgi:hypothetical protein
VSKQRQRAREARQAARAAEVAAAADQRARDTRRSERRARLTPARPARRARRYGAVPTRTWAQLAAVLLAVVAAAVTVSDGWRVPFAVGVAATALLLIVANTSGSHRR